jgi:hypothetical protein
MRIFDSSIVAEIAKENFKPFFMLELQLTTTLRWNDIDIDIFDDSGNKFSPMAFSFGSIAGSSNMSVESIDISIDDTNQAMSAILLGEDVRNKIAILYFGVVLLVSKALVTEGGSIILTEDGKYLIEYASGTTTAILTAEDGSPLTTESGDYIAAEAGMTGGVKYQELMRGIIGGWELYDDNKATITLTSEMVLWSKKSLRPQSSSCPWAFKGASGECGYVGDESLCDQSYDRCTVLVNTDNYGGDRFLPTIVTREVWWGRTSK